MSRASSAVGEGRVRRVLAGVVPPLVLVVAAIGLWQLAGRGGTSYLPGPGQVWRAFVRTRHVLPGHISTTLKEASLGVAIGVSTGIVVAIVITSLGIVRRAVQPLLVASQTIPFPVLVILLPLMYGYGLTPKVIIVVLVVFFPVAVSTASGLEHADRELVDLVRSFGGGPLQQFRHVRIPSAIPAALSGLRISLTYAFSAAVIAESVGAKSGLGLYIARSQRGFRYDQIWVGMFIVILVSMALYSAVQLIQRVTCPWLTPKPSPTPRSV